MSAFTQYVYIASAYNNDELVQHMGVFKSKASLASLFAKLNSALPAFLPNTSPGNRFAIRVYKAALDEITWFDRPALGELVFDSSSKTPTQIAHFCT